MLAERKLKGAGVVLPEMLETEEIINDLKDLGIYFYEETKRKLKKLKFSIKLKLQLLSLS